MAGADLALLRLAAGFALALTAGKAGGALAAKLKQPAVAGELLAGLAFAALLPLWAGPAEILRAPETALLAQLGLLLLLFEVGLHATPRELFGASGRALAVALIGVVLPCAGGWALVRALLPAENGAAALFIGAALSATSIAVSARVLKGANSPRGNGARLLVLGAAVLDDVLGLVLLAAVLAIIPNEGAGATPAPGALHAGLLALGKAAGFLIVALAAGMLFTKKLFRLAAKLEAEKLLLALGLVLCLLFSLGAAAAGLAPIVGAFAAGLVLEPAHSEFFAARGEQSLEDLLHPLSATLAPVFFVWFGASIDPAALLSPAALGWGAALSTIAIAGKLFCGLTADGKTADRWLVGLGMIPRGEVGLVYAAYAAAHAGLLPAPLIGGLVLMVLVTTLVTPPLLAARLRRMVAESG